MSSELLSQMPSVDHPELYRLNAVSAALDEARGRLILAGVSRQDVVGLESLVPGMLQGANPNSFTLNPSNTKLAVALEAIDLKKYAVVGAAITVAIGLIIKLFYWLKEMWINFQQRQLSEAAMKEAERQLLATQAYLQKQVNAAPDENSPVGEALRLITKYGVGDFSAFIFGYLGNEIQRHALTYKEAEEVSKEIHRITNVNGTTGEDLARYMLIFGLAQSRSAYLAPTCALALKTLHPKESAFMTNMHYAVAIIYDELLELMEWIEGTYRASKEGRDLGHYVHNLATWMRDFCNKFSRDGNIPPQGVFKITFSVEERLILDGDKSRRIQFPLKQQASFWPKLQELIDWYQENKTKRYSLYAHDHATGTVPFDKDGIRLLEALAHDGNREELAIFLRKMKTLDMAGRYVQMIKVLDRIEQSHTEFVSAHSGEVFERVPVPQGLGYNVKYLSIVEVVDNSIAFIRSMIMALRQIEELNLGISASADRALRMYVNATRDSVAFVKS